MGQGAERLWLSGINKRTLEEIRGMKRLASIISLAVFLTVSAAVAQTRINVIDFGADPTGVEDSADDINEAIEAVSKDMPLNPVGYFYGGEVYLPRGTYRLASTIKVNRGIHFYGESGSGWYAGTW